MAQAICSIPDCDSRNKQRRAHGWCQMHYKRWQKTGDPLVKSLPRPTLAERFWPRVDRSAGSDGCHPWTGSRNRDGYGTVNRKGGSTLAHVIAYELTVGPVPPGKVLDHYRCDNPPCCNPTHVRPATRRENTLRSRKVPAAINARKAHCKRGHPFDEANTATLRNGGRRCRACRNLLGH